MNFKILSPVSKPHEVEKVVNAGADEIYCGLLTKEWVKKYSNIISYFLFSAVLLTYPITPIIISIDNKSNKYGNR